MHELMLARQLSTQVNRAAATKDAQADFVARPYWAAGRFMMDNIGEVAKDIVFPVSFIQEPMFFSGGVLEDNQQVVAGQLPTFSGVVLSWVTEKHGPDTVLYTGCRIAAVFTGQTGQKGWVNWHFIGTALVNPIGSQESLEGVL